MKTFILTEKPSVARDFAKAIGVSPQGSGFFEGKNFIITWAIGHLLELKKPEEYDPKWKKWAIDNLPIIPDNLLYRENPGTKGQLKTIKKLTKRDDLEKIVLATDAGREGELIGRTILRYTGVEVPLFRFWTSQALSPSVIKEGLQNIVPIESYDRIYYAGLARQTADWLVGMNLTRLATIKMGDLYSIGRVQTAVLSLLHSRRESIDHFRSVPFYEVPIKLKFNENEIDSVWFDPKKKRETTRILENSKAEEIYIKCKNVPARLDSIEKKIISVKPPQLFSLTELQKTANHLYGFSAKKTLNLAQSLYEKEKCLSYPRTDSRVLGTKFLSESMNLIEVFKKYYPDHFTHFDDSKIDLSNKLVFNDKKLTDHHALVPLSPRNSKNQDDESKIFDLVLKRFIQCFSRDYEYEETKLVFKISSESFKSTGSRVICLGWKYLSDKKNEKIIPYLEKGQIGDVIDIKTDKKKTSPPSEYTEALLLNDMMNPSKLAADKLQKNIFKTEVGIGTQATRAQIIETLIERKYTMRNKKQLIITPKGQHLINNLNNMGLSGLFAKADETAKWEMQLEKIANGNCSPKIFLENIRNLVVNCTEEWKRLTLNKNHVQKKNEVIIGDCPLCDGQVTSSLKSYSCNRWREGCKFTIWKKIAGKSISSSQVKKIITKGRSDLIKNLKSKTGKSFDAYLVYEEQGIQFKFS